MTAECPHDLDPSWCTPCLDKTRPKTQREPSGRSFPAKYDGWCPACAEPIEAGDDILYSETDGGYVHDGCES